MINHENRDSDGHAQAAWRDPGRGFGRGEDPDRARSPALGVPRVRGGRQEARSRYTGSGRSTRGRSGSARGTGRRHAPEVSAARRRTHGCGVVTRGPRTPRRSDRSSGELAAGQRRVIDPRPVVIDASIGIAISRSEPRRTDAAAAITRWTGQGARIVVPSHFRLEVTNVLMRRHRWNGAATFEAIHEL